ncbi:MAG: ATP-binding protein, partial [bacterium]
MKEEYFSFTVDSALLNELGEKLVETVHLALLELVKNAYDADAKEVKIRFKPNPRGGPEIHVIDTGSGMSFEQVQSYWMRIATTNKVANDRSPLYGRPRAGSKGIGRFACRRLGSKLELITVAVHNGDHSKGTKKYEKTKVTFDWKKFTPGAEVTTIKCPGSVEISVEEETGTMLIISGAEQDEWSRRGYAYLKRQLAVLVANRGIRRSGYKEDPGFNIILEAPELEGDVNDLREQLISAGWGTLTASVGSDHHAICQLDALGIGKKTIVSKQTFPHLTGVSLNLGIIPISKGQIRKPDVLSLGTMKDILPTWGGVQVRYRGFRVYPYGEGDDDWLNIDRDRGRRKGTVEGELSTFAAKLRGVDPQRALLSMLSMKNYIGNAEIDTNATGFELKPNREGFIQSDAVEELKAFVRFAIDWSTIYRDYYIRKRAKEDSETAREYLEEVLEEDIEPGKVVESAISYL